MRGRALEPCQWLSHNKVLKLTDETNRQTSMGLGEDEEAAQDCAVHK